MAVFEAELERDPSLAEDLARYGENDTSLQAAFSQPVAAGVDEQLLARMGLSRPPLLKAPLPDAAPEPDARMTPANDDMPLFRRWRWPAGGAIAASLAALLLFQTGQSPEAEQKFAQALETLPSRQVAQLTPGETLIPVLSFRAGDGRYCREYIRRGGREDGTGIACRDSESWQVEAFVAGTGPIPDGGRIEAASGANPAALEATYARLKASDPLNGEKEKQAISDSWGHSGK